MGFFDFLGAAAKGVSTGLQTRDALQQRDRTQRIEEEDRQREIDLAGLERALLEFNLENARNPTPRFDVEDGQVVPQGGYTDRAEADRAAGAQRAAQRRTDMANRNREVAQAGRIAEATARGRAAGTPAETPDSGFGRLPVNVQSAVTQVGPAMQALDRYEEQARAYLGRAGFDRMAGAAGIPNPERDAAIGQLQSLQNQVLLNIKNLAELGVLNGPDLQIVTEMIGDPLSMSASIRDPQFVLTRITEARRFIQDRVNAIGSTYNIAVPGVGATSTGASTPPPAAPPAGNFYERYPYLRPPGN